MKKIRGYFCYLGLICLLLAGSISSSFAQFTPPPFMVAAASAHTSLYNYVAAGSGASTSFSGTTSSVTVTVQHTGDALLITSCAQPSLVTTGISVSPGGAATISPSSALNGTQDYCYIAIRANVTAGSTTVTATYGGTCTNCMVAAAEYSGLSTTATFDGTNAAAVGGGPGTTSCGSFTPAHNGDLIWAVTYSFGTVTTEAGYTAGMANPGTPASGVYDEYLTQTTAAAINPNFTATASGPGQYVLCAGFH